MNLVRPTLRPHNALQFSGPLLVVLAWVWAAPAAAQQQAPTPQAELAQYDVLIKPSDRQHWSFQPVRRPPLPGVRDATWLRNPTDAFVLAKLEAHGWKPSAPADVRALLRRVYLDLVGLPPTIAEQEAFANQPSSEAWERVVDDLLARP